MRWLRTPAYIASSTKDNKCGEMTRQRKTQVGKLTIDKV